jgi:predicted ribosome quality control (RQC) complex YloA/Tae2 family protein
MTASGKKVLAGKNAEGNEELVKQFIGKRNMIFHTEEPGSPFCVIGDLKPDKKDIEETAIFCAGKSQDWRESKSDVVVHVFSGTNIYKEKRMKTGMFGVSRFKKIIAKKKEIQKFLEK